MRLSCSSLDLLLSSLQTSVGALPRCTGGRRIVAVAAGGSLRSRRWRPYQQLIQKQLKKTHHGTRTLEGQCDRSATFQKILLRSRSYQKKKKEARFNCLLDCWPNRSPVQGREKARNVEISLAGFPDSRCRPRSLLATLVGRTLSL